MAGRSVLHHPAGTASHRRGVAEETSRRWRRIKAGSDRQNRTSVPAFEIAANALVHARIRGGLRRGVYETGKRPFRSFCPLCSGESSNAAASTQQEKVFKRQPYTLVSVTRLQLQFVRSKQESLVVTSEGQATPWAKPLCPRNVLVMRCLQGFDALARTGPLRLHVGPAVAKPSFRFQSATTNRLRMPRSHLGNGCVLVNACRLVSCVPVYSRGWHAHPCSSVPFVVSRPSSVEETTWRFRDFGSKLASLAVRSIHSRSGLSPTSSCRTPANSPPTNAAGSFTAFRRMGSSSKGPGSFGAARTAPLFPFRTRRKLRSTLGKVDMRESERALEHVIVRPTNGTYKRVCRKVG